MNADMPLQLVERFVATGFRWSDDIVLAFLAGSHQHGARLEGKSDLDIAGVYIEPPWKILGLDVEEHFTHTTAGDDRKNTAEDADYKLYSLRHWAKLAVKGNPTVLSFLYTPEAIRDLGCDHNVWTQLILPNREAFLASSHATAFIGFGRAQLHRMQGLRGRGAHGQRPELEQVHGYDVKAAMHMLRMGYECLELLQTGVITYPRPEVATLMDIRLGRWPQTRVEQTYLRLEDQIHTAEQTSTLPRRVDRDRISQLIARAYVAHWNERGYLP